MGMYMDMDMDKDLVAEDAEFLTYCGAEPNLAGVEKFWLHVWVCAPLVQIGFW